MRERQRNRAENHRTRRHQDWPQAQRCRFHHRLEFLHAPAAQLIGEFHDKNAVLGNQAYQHHQADLAIDVQRAAVAHHGIDPHHQQRAGQRQRHREHDHQRTDEALELSRQHQIDEDQGQQEGEEQLSAGFTELAGLPIQIRDGSGRQLRLDCRIDRIERLAQSGAGRDIAVDHRSAQFVEVVELLRRDGLVEPHQIGKLNQLIVPAAYVYRGQIGRLHAFVVFHLHHDVVLLALVFVAGNVAAAEQRLQCVTDDFHRHAKISRFFAIDVHGQLGLVEFQIGVEGDDARILAQLGHDLSDLALQFLVAVPVDHILDLLGQESLAERRRVERERERARQAPEQFRPQFLGDLHLGAVAFAPGLQYCESDAEVDRVRTVEPGGDHREHGGDFRDRLGDGLDLVHVAVGVLHGGAFGRNYESQEQAAVFHRREFRLQLLVHQHHAAQHHHEKNADDPTMPECRSQDRPVAIVHALEKVLGHVVDGAVRTMWLEQSGTHHRRQRQRNKAGNNHRRRHGQRELGEQLAGIAGHQRQGCEHGRKRDGHGNNCKTDFLAPLEGGFHRLHAFLDVAMDVFQHHDRVVHHQPYRQHHA